MRHIIAILLPLLAVLPTKAQDATYHLPRTAVRITVLAERTRYTPGDLAAYSRRFLKKDAATESATTFRIVSATLRPVGLPDTARVYTAHIDQKHNIQGLALSPDGCLLAINAEARPQTEPQPFQSAPAATPEDPYKHLSQDILATGSRLKMAELAAKEIYDIRDSRNELTRGQADYMPKDGEQLRLMLSNLDRQEGAIRQLFEGVTQRDTTEHTLTFTPTPGTTETLLFRFSKYFGLVDNDDLSGEPYTMTVDDLHSAPAPIAEPQKKAPKDETGVWVALPGKIRLTLAGPGLSQQLEVAAAQYGEVENLNEPLFSKKVQTTLVLNTWNGGIDKIDSLPVK